MWVAQRTLLDDQVHKFNLLKNNASLLTYEDVVREWRESSEFRSFYFSILLESPFEAFFWEHPPVTRSDIKQIYEFVLVKSPQLARVSADPNPFRERFKADASVITFENLGRDAELIVPCPMASQKSYAHFASFIRSAPENQKHDLFIALANRLGYKVGDQPTWVSTSGLGVYWLHIRLDTRPKYYSYEPYRHQG